MVLRGRFPDLNILSDDVVSFPIDAPLHVVRGGHGAATGSPRANQLHKVWKLPQEGSRPAPGAIYTRIPRLGPNQHYFELLDEAGRRVAGDGLEMLDRRYVRRWDVPSRKQFLEQPNPLLAWALVFRSAAIVRDLFELLGLHVQLALALSRMVLESAVASVDLFEVFSANLVVRSTETIARAFLECT